MNSSQSIFNKIHDNAASIRYDENIPQDIFLGRDENNRLLMFAVSNIEPVNIVSSNLIEVQKGLRKDKLWTLSFILKDTAYTDLFCYFCDDMIFYALENINEDIINSFSARYIKWQNMLKQNKSGLLSKEAVKGLIGEIHFLINSLSKKYGIEKAVSSWAGMEYNTHDFICDDLWYEIKSIKHNTDAVTISSIEQLDCPDAGKLVINYIDDTSMADINKITLNSIVDDMLNMINNKSLQIIIYNKLIDYGYIRRQEYDNMPFKFIKKETYNVNSSFPSIRRKDIPETVKNAKYEIFITKIKDFLEAEYGY